ncbi:hypothetical protein [Candidatus Poriferisodalis sp.]|uniref:hypothetical protein n=1 Tax=Candidatus Poriferisodalis sp. TaxID=3101277 RepID=UPI003B02190A
MGTVGSESDMPPVSLSSAASGSSSDAAVSGTMRVPSASSELLSGEPAECAVAGVAVAGGVTVSAVAGVSDSLLLQAETNSAAASATDAIRFFLFVMFLVFLLRQ